MPLRCFPVPGFFDRFPAVALKEAGLFRLIPFMAAGVNMNRLSKIAILALLSGEAIFLLIKHGSQQRDVSALSVSAETAAENKSWMTFSPVTKIKNHQVADANEVGSTTITGLRLVGVVLGSDGDSSMRAIIAMGKKQEIYSLNAVLPVNEKVTLEKIFSDRVILNNQGRYETLWLYDSIQSPVDESPPIADAPKEAPLFYGRIPSLDEPPPYVPDQRAEEIALSQVTEKLTGIMNISIYRGEDSHQLIGYKIGLAKDTEKFKALGLRTDDLITAINGVPLTKPEDILETYKNNVEGPVNLEIERDGSVITVDVARYAIAQ